ncbi:MAG: WD40/YVTN/BNR-like repeat-containing protein [Micromonosporaceae bacterium]
MTTTLLAIGTAKGLFLAHSDDRRSWELSGPHFPMTGVYAVAIDTRRQPTRLLAGVHSSHFGPIVATSDDLGASWQEPDERPIAFPADAEKPLARVWQIALGPADEPDVVYAGTEPQGLFRSTDGGLTYELVRGLYDHPHRPEWGGGFGGPAIHTVLPHPTDSQRVVVAMSTGGVYRTDDGGKSWNAANSGIRAVHLPDPFPEFGQCVHKVARSRPRPEQLFAQVHHGVYRSDDDGRTWSSIAADLPSDFGFPMVAHPRRPGVIFNFPLQADMRRFPPEERCRVYRSEDAGTTWRPLSAGLPDEPFYPTVLRDAMCVDDADVAGVYFGTRTGEVFASADEGEHWQQIAAHLPDVLCVRAAVL